MKKFLIELIVAFLKLSLGLAIALNSLNAFAYMASLSWTKPTTNADGAPITDLAGYRVYYGTSSHSYSRNIDVGNATMYNVKKLHVGIPYFFAVTAYDRWGNESEHSNEVTLLRYSLSLNKSGTGEGTVTSSPAGINCSSNCSKAFNVGTIVTLTAEPQADSTFSGWSGGRCTGTGQCLLTMNSNMTVTANFSSETPVVVAFPNGGEVIPSGSTAHIQWWASPDTAKVDLQYSIDNGITWMNIANGVSGTTSYNWIIPLPMNNKNQCFVKVVGYNSSNLKTGEDKSNATFSIVVVQVTAPIKGETLKSGNIYTIRWTTNATNSPVTKVKLLYTTNGGSTWNLIDTLTSNPGSYNWKVPIISSNNCRVKIVLKDAGGNRMGIDKSNGYFTIQP
jgi:fibronectin type 3 domain-containing protein